MKLNKILICFLTLCTFLPWISGCGSTDGGISDWEKQAPVVTVVNLQGKILSPVISGNRLSPLLFNNVAGTNVYIEGNSNYSAEADANGDFIIYRVPAGKYRVVSEITVGLTTYRQRSDQITLTGEYETQSLPSSLQLVAAPYRVSLIVKDIATDRKLPNVALSVWGHQYFTDSNGLVTVGPMPDGVWPIKTSLAGYVVSNLTLGFKELRKSVLEVKLTPLTLADKNQAPAVEIEQSFKTITTNGTGMLSAFGFDPDGDYIQYSWQATSGSFSQIQGATTVFTAPPTSSTVSITLIGDDRKGGIGKSVLNIDILSGGLIPSNPNNQAPYAATDPLPTNNSINIGTDVVLRWNCTDPDGDNLVYDFFMAKRGDALKLIASNLTDAYYHINQLEVNQVYYWQVIARDVYGAITPTPPMWQFTTGDQDNFSPYQPSNPVPADLSVDQLTTLLFSWTGGDPDQGDSLKYSFYLGTDSANLKLASVTARTSLEIENLENGWTYYWKIVSADNRGKETQGAIWRFTTFAVPNSPPNTPIVVLPASASINIAVDTQLRWDCTDPNNEHLTYDLFFGTIFPLKKVAENLDAPVYSFVDHLDFSTKYYWQVIARDSDGAVNANSSIWSFTTKEKTNTVPTVPTALNPANSTSNVALKPVFSWTGGDPDGDKVVYDLYLDTVSPPVSKKTSNLSLKSWTPPTELKEGTQYYWQIFAKDTAAHLIESPVFSFFTSTESGGDTVAPTIISVEPVDDEGDVNAAAEIRIIFSESMNRETVENAISMQPNYAGAWTWENDAIVRFWPTSPWNPGSFHKILIAQNTIRDEAGNLLVSANSSSFTVKSDLPVPAGYHSMGFPIGATSVNSTVDVQIPELKSGAVAYAVVVTEETPANVTVKASKNTDWYKSAPEAVFRDLERALVGKKIPEVMLESNQMRASVIPMGAQQVGTIQNFYIPAAGGIATTTSYPNNVIQAECVGVTDGVYMYVDKAIQSLDSNLISEVRKRFEESIQPKVQDAFGMEPNVGPDGDSRLTILLTDSMADGIAGIFYAADLFANDPLDSQLKESNARKLFYMKYSLNSDILRYGTTAHEFQHMVNFWQKRINAGSGVFEETWLNEGLSKFSEEVCGYGMPQGDDNTARLVKLSQDNYKTLSLTEWEGLNSYGLSYLFVRFIAQENRYGTSYRDVTRQLVQSSKTGKANVEAITGEPFKTTLARWYLSLLLNNYTSSEASAYGLGGLNLEGSYAGVQLYGFEPEELAYGQTSVSEIPAWGGALYKKTSVGNALTQMKFSGFNGNAQIWLIDKR